jgi:hypothetical protein
VDGSRRGTMASGGAPLTHRLHEREAGGEHQFNGRSEGGDSAL